MRITKKRIGISWSAESVMSIKIESLLMQSEERSLLSIRFQMAVDVYSITVESPIIGLNELEAAIGSPSRVKMTKRILASATAVTRFDSPLGVLRIVFSNDVLVGLYLPAQPKAECFDSLQEADHAIARPVQHLLSDFFAGASDAIDGWEKSANIRWQLIGTDFQQQVWNQLLGIPFGQFRTYGFISNQVGRPTAFRAVGTAIGDNPLSILVPCHRVIGASGALTGYAGGMGAKQWLLKHEQCAGFAAV